MATANSVSSTVGGAHTRRADLMVHVASMPSDQFEVLLHKLAQALPDGELLVAAAESPLVEVPSNIRVISGLQSSPSWTLTAADFANAYQLGQTNHTRAILMLGPQSDSLQSSTLAELAQSAAENLADLIMPHYLLPPTAGLVNSGILYPLTRALFAQRAKYPLAVDMGLSMRMAERLAAAAQRFMLVNQGNSILWPMNEAAVAGLTILEHAAGTRELPQPIEADLNSILALVTGSLFADVDAKAAFWQRARPLPPVHTHFHVSADSVPGTDVAPMLDSFRLAYTNLREIWSLVLPPNTLVALKRLSLMDASTFRIPDNLWARIIYDFLLAFRLRTINRGHLLGALTPLYLAWVASHFNVIASGTASASHIEAVAEAFETDKPYLVSRWRWPDRFNP